MERLRWADICDEEDYDALDPWGCLHTEWVHEEETGHEARAQKTNVENELTHVPPKSLAAAASASAASWEKASSPEDIPILVPVKEPHLREDDSRCNCFAGPAGPQRARTTFWQLFTDSSDLALRVEVCIVGVREGWL